MNSAQAIAWPAPPRWSVGDLLEELNARLPDTVREAFLFGSYARGDANQHSDIDLIVVMPTRERWTQRAATLEPALLELGAMDVLVYTPEEWASLREASGFLRSIRTELVRIR